MGKIVNEKYLDKFSIEYKLPDLNFLADELLDVIDVGVQSAPYNVWDRPPLKLLEDEASYHAPAPEFDLKREREPVLYSCQLKKAKNFVNDEEEKANKDWTSLTEDAVIDLKRGMLLKKEYSFVNNLLESDIDGTSGTYHTTPTVKWNASSGTIIIEKNIRDAIKTFETNCLMTPNILVIPKQVWDGIVMDATLRNLWLLVPGRKNQDIELSSIMKLLFDNFKKIYIPNIKYDTAGKKATPSLSSMYGNHVTMLYKNPGRPGPKAFTWGMLFRYEKLKTKQWREEDPEGTWVRLSYSEDKKETARVARYTLKNVII
jgi:hypothetical protein